MRDVVEIANRSDVGAEREFESAPLLISRLTPGDSPRISGLSDDHVRRLAEVEAALPPILVHRPTMRVIDGMHRLHAAALRGDAVIMATYFDGGEFEAFVQAVRSNNAHGLPLSCKERETAAKRILAARPNWSDRAIAEVTGLSAPTVAAVRGRSTERFSQSNSRVGRDGRVRPLDGAARRQKAVEIIRSHPGASLREIAKEAGISVGTAHNVRLKLREEEAAAEATRLSGGGGDPQDGDFGHSASRALPPPDSPADDRRKQQVLHSLRRDPSLRMSRRGRFLLQWLGILSLGPDGLDQFALSVPNHWLKITADLARESAATWKHLADELERRADGL
ncbi:ParB/RepB/Spo0J family partition protein [Actinacidiphila yeochonensis]|uniref:ParB/RepB/Spo0J family partition protein n=1 Tax=Actinacidiphila yeochonensis TaxID=89050 RepID=UPI00068E22A0|nr:ParB/RepB/Spo0J family partition protein [Actinacidiphila yeochonensis]